jgi:site-specific recombinase XerD
MNVSDAAKLYLEYHRSHSKENSLRAYMLILSKFCETFGDESMDALTTDRVLSFLNRITKGNKKHTKQTRYSQLLAFFNFIKNNFDDDLKNPFDTLMMKKLFKAKSTFHWDIIEKETIDEVIFRTTKTRNRLILELMAQGGMRISEVLKLTPSDIIDRRFTLK